MSNSEINSHGTKIWYNSNGEYHRKDGPAIERVNGNKYWYINGEPHREDGPAVEYPNGDKFWYKYGKYHRTDGPAIEYTNGTKYWYLNGKLYSEKQFVDISYKINYKIML